MRFPLLVLIVLVASLDLALAGAWPRDKGAVFVSGQVRQDVDTLDDAPVISVYGEYGLTDAWTLGGKLNYAIATRDVTQAKAFARWHMPDGDGMWQAALSLSVEGADDGYLVSPALHLGRGFDTMFGPGWLDVEVAASLSVLEPEVDYSAFTLIGVKPNPTLMTMLALDVTTMDVGAQIDMIPSVAWEYKQGKYLQVEWSHALGGAVKDEIAAGIWLEF